MKRSKTSQKLSEMRVLFIITARGGSKGVPGKNIREIGGIPLLAYKAISANKTRCEKRIILSTDSHEIAEIGRKCGIEVPFMRPKHLATSKASSIDVIKHAMGWVEKNDENQYDAVFLLEPSSPFGTWEDFEQALNILAKPGVDNVVAVKEVHPNTIFSVYLGPDGSLATLGKRLAKLKTMRRQDFKPEYTPSGALYCSRWEAFKKRPTFYSSRTYTVIQEDAYAVEIDSMVDLAFTEFVVEKGLIDLSYWKDLPRKNK